MKKGCIKHKTAPVNQFKLYLFVCRTHFALQFALLLARFYFSTFYFFYRLILCSFVECFFAIVHKVRCMCSWKRKKCVTKWIHFVKQNERACSHHIFIDLKSYCCLEQLSFFFLHSCVWLSADKLLHIEDQLRCVCAVEITAADFNIGIFSTHLDT